MSSIMPLIEGYMTGNAWEDLCVQCYRIRYQGDNYKAIPAVDGGDAGIEGFTLSGIVHQCYCPEREYTDGDLYTHQRTKLNKDIGKLMSNSKRLKEFGVPPVVEWHFNIPEYRDSKIITYAQSKQQEVLHAKKDSPADYEHIADSFKIIIKIADDFTPEISQIIRTNLTDFRLNLAVQHTDSPDWSKCDSQKVENISRKIKAVMHIDDDSNEDLNSIINTYVGCYISGVEIMNRLRVGFPEIHEGLFQLEQSYKREVSIRTRISTDRTLNQSLFESILNEFQEKLEKDFSKMFTIASIGELKQDLIASWLADCSMEFRSL